MFKNVNTYVSQSNFSALQPSIRILTKLLVSSTRVSNDRYCPALESQCQWLVATESNRAETAARLIVARITHSTLVSQWSVSGKWSLSGHSVVRGHSVRDIQPAAKCNVT